MATYISDDEALAMLKPGDYIHTFRQAGFALIGADWEREQVIEAIRTHGAQLTGETATSMGHGIAVADGRGYVFFETHEDWPGYDRIALGA